MPSTVQLPVARSKCSQNSEIWCVEQLLGRISDNTLLRKILFILWSYLYDGSDNQSQRLMLAPTINTERARAGQTFTKNCVMGNKNTTTDCGKIAYIRYKKNQLEMAIVKQTDL